MKALTLHQPWASLVAHGEKRFETRHWFTHHRDWLAIHAAKTIPAYARDCLEEPDIADALEFAGFVTLDQLPRGCVVAIAELVACHRITPELRQRASLEEQSFGDWSIGRYAWELRNVQRFTHLVPVRGAQGLWDIPDDHPALRSPVEFVEEWAEALA